MNMKNIKELDYLFVIMLQLCQVNFTKNTTRFKKSEESGSFPRRRYSYFIPKIDHRSIAHLRMQTFPLLRHLRYRFR